MATIKELQALYLKHQVAEAANAAKAAEELELKMRQQAEDVADLLIQAVTFTPFVKFPSEVFSAVFKATLEVFEHQGVQVSKDHINNNLRDLMVLLEAIDPRMDLGIQTAARAKLTAPAKPKEIGVTRFQDRKDKKKAAKKERQPWNENPIAKAMAKAKADAEAKAKANPNGLPEGAEDLTEEVA